PQRLDQRLFMQLIVVSALDRSKNLGISLGEEIHSRGVGVVVYEDVCDPLGYGILTYSTNPAVFTEKVRPAMRTESLGDYEVRHDLSMMGRTYSTGYEQD